MSTSETGIEHVCEIETDREVLSWISEPIETTNPTSEDVQELKDILNKLIHTAVHHALNNPGGCAGLAANQIGIFKRVFVMRHGNTFVAVVNPEVIDASTNTTKGREGRLSFPGQHSLVRRPKWVKVRYICPEQGRLVKKKLHGFDARVFMHELDHLNGVLI